MAKQIDNMADVIDSRAREGRPKLPNRACQNYCDTQQNAKIVLFYSTRNGRTTLINDVPVFRVKANEFLINGRPFSTGSAASYIVTFARAANYKGNWQTR